MIFNIQQYSLHDGPGIRTIVFMKGCPLRCRWCCNPESQKTKPEISYDANKCLGKKICNECEKICDAGAIEFSDLHKAVIRRDKCSSCMKCVHECPAKAYKAEGHQYSIREVLDIVEKDSIFYRHGNGGLTVSGGEPLMQGEFLIQLLRQAKKRRLTTAIETCGYADYPVLKQAAEYLDAILFDIKSLDEQQHIAYTGKTNRKILQNFDNLCRDFPDLPKYARTPVIPGFNDSPDDLLAIKNYLANKPETFYEQLPYHRFGAAKYNALGRRYMMDE